MFRKSTKPHVTAPSKQQSSERQIANKYVIMDKYEKRFSPEQLHEIVEIGRAIMKYVESSEEIRRAFLNKCKHEFDSLDAIFILNELKTMYGIYSYPKLYALIMAITEEIGISEITKSPEFMRTNRDEKKASGRVRKIKSLSSVGLDLKPKSTATSVGTMKQQHKITSKVDDGINKNIDANDKRPTRPTSYSKINKDPITEPKVTKAHAIQPIVVRPYRAEGVEPAEDDDGYKEECADEDGIENGKNNVAEVAVEQTDNTSENIKKSKKISGRSMELVNFIANKLKRKKKADTEEQNDKEGESGSKHGQNNTQHKKQNTTYKNSKKVNGHDVICKDISTTNKVPPPTTEEPNTSKAHTSQPIVVKPYRAEGETDTIETDEIYDEDCADKVITGQVVNVGSANKDEQTENTKDKEKVSRHSSKLFNFIARKFKKTKADTEEDVKEKEEETNIKEENNEIESEEDKRSKARRLFISMVNEELKKLEANEKTEDGRSNDENVGLANDKNDSKEENELENKEEKKSKARRLITFLAGKLKKNDDVNEKTGEDSRHEGNIDLAQNEKSSTEENELDSKENKKSKARRVLNFLARKVKKSNEETGEDSKMYGDDTCESDKIDSTNARTLAKNKIDSAQIQKSEESDNTNIKQAWDDNGHNRDDDADNNNRIFKSLTTPFRWIQKKFKQND